MARTGVVRSLYKAVNIIIIIIVNVDCVIVGFAKEITVRFFQFILNTRFFFCELQS